MINNKPKLVVLGVALTSLGLGGCATVDEELTARVTTLESHVSAQDGRIGALEGKTNNLDGRVGALEAKIDRVEKGKFNYQKVAEETVLFDTGSYALKPEEATKLDGIITRLKTEDKGVYVEIEGFADPRGGGKENRELSLRRARTVYNHFRDQGVALNRVMLFNQGEEHQLVDTGHAENRRVVVTVVQ